MKHLYSTFIFEMSEATKGLKKVFLPKVFLMKFTRKRRCNKECPRNPTFRDKRNLRRGSSEHLLCRQLHCSTIKLYVLHNNIEDISGYFRFKDKRYNDKQTIIF